MGHACVQVYYRAIYACPSSKALWLDAFTGMRQVFTPQELHDLLRLMVAKDIALRIEPPAAPPATA